MDERGEAQEKLEKIKSLLNSSNSNNFSLGEFQQACKRTVKEFPSDQIKIMTWGLGIVGEAGDVAGCIKKTFVHNNEVTQGIRENLGDTMWYIANICNFFNWSLEDILKENIDKLHKRYPQGFTYKDANRGWKDWNEGVDNFKQQ